MLSVYTSNGFGYPHVTKTYHYYVICIISQINFINSILGLTKAVPNNVSYSNSE